MFFHGFVYIKNLEYINFTYLIICSCQEPADVGAIMSETTKIERMRSIALITKVNFLM